MVREATLYADTGMRPPTLSVISEGVGVTKRLELWAAAHRDYRGPGRLELNG
jgi:hypothetical protein